MRLLVLDCSMVAFLVLCLNLGSLYMENKTHLCQPRVYADQAFYFLSSKIHLLPRIMKLFWILAVCYRETDF